MNIYGTNPAGTPMDLARSAAVGEEIFQEPRTNVIPTGRSSGPFWVGDALGFQIQITFDAVPTGNVTVEFASDKEFTVAGALDTIAPAGAQTDYTYEYNGTLPAFVRVTSAAVSDGTFYLQKRISNA